MKFRFSFIAIFLLSVFPRLAFGHALTGGDRYYYYIGLGGGVGGFVADVDSTLKVPINANQHFHIGNGFAGNGVAGGLTANFGFDWVFKNNFYLSGQINGNVFFNNTVQSDTFTSGSAYIVAQTHTFIHPNGSQNVGNAINAFGGVYGALNIGWAGAGDSLFVYGIVGAGYEFIPSDISNPNAARTDYVWSDYVNFGGGRIQYGFGLKYYFHENFGFFVQAVLTSPIPQGAGSYSHVDIVKIVSHSYFINIGLNIRF